MKGFFYVIVLVQALDKEASCLWSSVWPLFVFCQPVWLLLANYECVLAEVKSKWSHYNFVLLSAV